MEKKFCEVKFKSWIINKLESWVIASSVNTAYRFEVVKETFIVDELNHIIYDCQNLTKKQIDNILKEHEEWRITCLKVF